MPSPNLSGIIPMVRIDGARVRRLREGKGLTQLYLSTVVGVTTDTISRWENRHYQSIKLDNAEKLAGALEVALAEILELPQPESESAPLREEGTIAPAATSAQEVIPPKPGRRRLKLLIVAAAVFALAVVGLLLYALFPRQPRGAISAQRILPPQAPPGQTFPVLIRVRSAGQGARSLILKETLPAGSRSLQSVPAPTSVDLKDNSLKWISRTETGDSVYTYLCQVPPGAANGETLSFSGTVTRKQTLGEQEGVTGAATLTVAPFHWADSNRDQVIDDEEILAVYDLYSEIEGLDIDRDRIDSLWAAGGYHWDEKKKKYVIQEW
ncbi:MAG: helix-turn-helix domain-containing protein [Desulfobulbaceae bacterium]